MAGDAMKERPILFSAPMVRALLAGTKTQTRRLFKQCPSPERFASIEAHPSYPGEWVPYADGQAWPSVLCPYGDIGDRLWVRETWQELQQWEQHGERFTDVAGPGDTGRFFEYAATNQAQWGGPWRPSIFMPRAASRITLEITDVRVQRLREISEADAMAEGWEKQPERSADQQVHWDAARDWYADLWESINGAGTWDANPWVWAITFRKGSNRG